jgi:hypothetical protein
MVVMLFALLNKPEVSYVVNNGAGGGDSDLTGDQGDVRFADLIKLTVVRIMHECLSSIASKLSCPEHQLSRTLLLKYFTHEAVAQATNSNYGNCDTSTEMATLCQSQAAAAFLKIISITEVVQSQNS